LTILFVSYLARPWVLAHKLDLGDIFCQENALRVLSKVFLLRLKLKLAEERRVRVGLR
jgi:hypothetical protein